MDTKSLAHQERPRPCYFGYLYTEYLRAIRDEEDALRKAAHAFGGRAHQLPRLRALEPGGLGRWPGGGSVSFALVFFDSSDLAREDPVLRLPLLLAGLLLHLFLAP